MYALRLFTGCNKLYLKTLKTRPFLLLNYKQPVIKKNYCTKFNLRSQVQKDNILFKYNKPHLFVLINSFSITQCICWCYLSYFLFEVMEDSELNSKSPFWNWLYKEEKNYRKILGLVASFVGITVFLATYFYTARSVKNITLHCGGKNLTIVTYKVPGFNNVLNVPVKEVSASQIRQNARAFLPLKVKGRFFYYLLDMKGEFINPVLFDYTAGIQRNF